VSCTDHSSPHYAVSSTPLLPRPSQSQIFPSAPILKHPQPAFLPQYHRPCFTPTQKMRQNYSSVYPNLYLSL
jgi:hypothetical protein